MSHDECEHTTAPKATDVLISTCEHGRVFVVLLDQFGVPLAEAAMSAAAAMYFSHELRKAAAPVLAWPLRSPPGRHDATVSPLLPQALQATWVVHGRLLRPRP